MPPTAARVVTPEVDIVNTTLKRSALAIAAIAVAIVALPGCTPGGSSGSGGGRSSTTTIDDLVTAMNAVYYAAK